MIGNTMKEIIYAIFLSFFLCGLCGNAEAKKKKEVKKAIKREVQTPYDKLFKGKKAFTVNGLMKMHLMAGKVYAEFPIELLNRDLALTSSIEDISDNGEGVVGQFAGRVNQFRFTLQDSMLQARLVRRGCRYDRTFPGKFQVDESFSQLCRKFALRFCTTYP